MTIHKSITIARPPEVAFKVFCQEIGRWWPIKHGFSFGGERTVNMFIEGQVGGRFYEVASDGTQLEIGRVTAYEPPRMVAFTWRAPSWEIPTQVEVRFSADGTGTRVELDHVGWEHLPAPGDSRKSYDGGWDFVLGEYRTQADAISASGRA
jgi:uncharacterized protein YndB with AHSA1/START domain